MLDGLTRTSPGWIAAMLVDEYCVVDVPAA